MSTSPSPKRVFVSYSTDDEPLWQQMKKHLSALERRGLITAWTFRKIVPGATWDEAIRKELDAADILLLLMSASFIASKYCWEVEVERALQRRQAGTAVVIPVILKPCDWKSLPLGHVQALPRNGKPVVEWKPRDKAWLDVAEGIARVVESMSAVHAAQVTASPPSGGAPAAGPPLEGVQVANPPLGGAQVAQRAPVANRELDLKKQLEVATVLQREMRSIRVSMEKLVMAFGMDMGHLEDNDWIGLVRAVHAGIHKGAGDRANAVRQLVLAALTFAPDNTTLSGLAASL